MLSRPDLSEILEKIVRGRYKHTGFGWVPYPRHIHRAKSADRVPGPDFFCSETHETSRRHRIRTRPIGWPVGQHSIIDVERHLRLFLKSQPRWRIMISDQADAYISAFQHNIVHARPEMREAAPLFMELWKSIEDSNPECEKCFKMFKIRRARFEKALRDLES